MPEKAVGKYLNEMLKSIYIVWYVVVFCCPLAFVYMYMYRGVKHKSMSSNLKRL